VPVPIRQDGAVNDHHGPAVWYGLDEVPTDLGRAVVSIGVFDGVHRGHRQILGRAVSRARALGVPTVVVTFDPHPSEVVRPGTHPALLSTVGHRAQLLGAAGADAVCVLPFTTAFSRLSPEEFVGEVLVGRLHAAVVVVGASFRFGHRAVGTVETLRAMGADLGFDVEVVELVGDGEVTWSSTYVRQCVMEGDVGEAAAVLGRPHRVEGEVVHGDHRGRSLGYPTANLRTTEHAAVPADGVYAGWLVLADGSRLPAAVSVGSNPTFDGVERRVEAYALDRDDLQLYGQDVAVEFAVRLRGMTRFGSVPELLAQMADDVARTRALVAG
jgi:riboflavin kinase/FMN adenylyltransferase